jgi:X-Pro dipeptidyl-peptidase
MDSDHDGHPDRIAVAILRPAETRRGMRVATVLQASPYTGRATNAATVTPPDPGVFSEWYSGYFVPRGYAVAEVEMQGTGQSEGCPTTGGPDDTRSVTAAIRWLTGRAVGHYAGGKLARADWSTGAIGMIGLSYDGTLAEAAATTGIAGLRTIVPESAISSWYDYARDQGIGYAGSWGDRYPEYQADRVISDAARAKCADVLTTLGDDAGDATYDYTPFWAERNYLPHVGRIRASVLLAQGLTDPKVRGREFSTFWRDLVRYHVPRKLWLHNGGHVDPIEAGAQQWQETVHRWMDYWLYHIPSGIMSEPRVDIQRPNGAWETDTDWPAPTAHDTRLFLRASSTTGTGTLASSPSPAATQSLVDDPNQPEGTMIADPAVGQAHRLVYVSPALPQAARLSGTPEISIRTSSSTPSTPLTALLVDYDNSSAITPADKSGPPPTSPIITRGSIDAKNRYSLTSQTPLQPGRTYTITWQLHATDYVIPAGHHIGLAIVANDNEYIAGDPAAGTVTIDLGPSNIVLPLSNVR